MSCNELLQRKEAVVNFTIVSLRVFSYNVSNKIGTRIIRNI